LNNGFTWQESFERRRLLADGDLALLSAAERTGNLPWALDEMGDSFLRRSEYRLKVWGELAMPLLLLVFGLSVALYVIARFVPLTTIINDLS
jgi:type II secretory pathway component PulF